MHKTTAKEVAYFEDRVKHWLKVLSLGDWKVEVYAGSTELEGFTNSAICEMWHNAHGAHIRIKEKFDHRPTRPWLDRLALHEVCHILLCDLKRLINERGTTEAQAETAEHAIIRRLENCLK